MPPDPAPHGKHMWHCRRCRLNSADRLDPDPPADRLDPDPPADRLDPDPPADRLDPDPPADRLGSTAQCGMSAAAAAVPPTFPSDFDQADP